VNLTGKKQVSAFCVCINLNRVTGPDGIFLRLLGCRSTLGLSRSRLTTTLTRPARSPGWLEGDNTIVVEEWKCALYLVILSQAGFSQYVITICIYSA